MICILLVIIYCCMNLLLSVASGVATDHDCDKRARGYHPEPYLGIAYGMIVGFALTFYALRCFEWTATNLLLCSMACQLLIPFVVISGRLLILAAKLAWPNLVRLFCIAIRPIKRKWTCLMDVFHFTMKPVQFLLELSSRLERIRPANDSSEDL